MQILYDNAAFDMQRYGGVSKCFCEVIRHLPEGVVPHVSVLSTENVYLRALYPSIPLAAYSYSHFIPRHEFRGKYRLYNLLMRFFPKRFPDFRFANNNAFKDALRIGGYDVIHLTGPHTYGAAWRNYVGRIPIVITVHDLIPELLWHDRKITKERRTVLGLVDRIIAVSQHTKNDLISTYDVPSDKIDVIYHGPSSRVTGEVESGGYPSGRYVLYVGGRMGYKRFDLLVKAIAMLDGGCGDVRVVCTGAPFCKQEVEMMAQHGVADRFSSQFVADSNWGALFSHALAFVYPSDYEGFGIPIVDALQNGCPTILSRSSCFPEIGADAALYFSSGDASSLCKCLSILCHDEAKREELIRLGRVRGRAFSWEKCASEVVATYKKVINDA